MSALNNTTENSAAGWSKWAGSLLSSIASAIPAFQSLATAQAATAITGAASSTSSIPVVGWVMALAAIASMVAAFSQMPKFATGGIVGGSSFIGDNVLARLNSGEMVLNGRQQKNLFSLLNEGNNGNSKMEFTIRGKDLYAVMNNYNKKINKYGS
jgi:hypothetical protein